MLLVLQISVIYNDEEQKNIFLGKWNIYISAYENMTISRK